MEHIYRITFMILLNLHLLCLDLVNATFGNEYVHIKVHVPKEEAPIPPHKVIHHYHHHPHPLSRPKKHYLKPLLESIILADLEKPLPNIEHADFLNHAKELGDHLASPVETYTIKPTFRKKFIKPYAELGTDAAHDYVPHYEYHETHKMPSSSSSSGSYDDDLPAAMEQPGYGGGYQYDAPQQYENSFQHYHTPGKHAKGIDTYQAYKHPVQMQLPAINSYGGYEDLSDFRPSPQFDAQQFDSEEDDIDSYRHRHSMEAEADESTGYGEAAAEPYNEFPSVASTGYKYTLPFA